MIPFQPEDRLNMVGWMAANSDPDGYGELVAFTFPSGRDVDGPGLAYSRITRTRSSRPLGRSSGRVREIRFGDLLTIPVEDSILYVLPTYVRAAQEAAVPELKLVIVNGAWSCRSPTSTRRSRTRPAPPLVGSRREAVAEVEAVAAEPPTNRSRTLTQAVQHFTAADACARDGDLATYQSGVAAGPGARRAGEPTRERRFAHPFPVALRDPLALEPEPGSPASSAVSIWAFWRCPRSPSSSPANA